MDGMQTSWWDVENENPENPAAGSRVTFNMNFPGINAIAEIGVASFSPLLAAPDEHALGCGFTRCTWVDEGGKTHNDDLVDGLPTYQMWPVIMARNGLTSLSGEIDVTAMAGRVSMNVFIWPHVY